MITTTGHYTSPRASGYLQQLCKHFAHKIAVEFDEVSGKAEMGFGRFEAKAGPDRLTVQLWITDPALLDQARHVIDKHLAIFAHREGFETLDWTAPVAA
ncbi:DUF2218 domain-containing protein [Neotabrizicola sp. sgz301269]|uniref:DUF2218 domain-containing protein n=1 Tax=Neotabrizicola sp. sgz301269 TaxID=3276282 RepID=UPI00376F5634